MDIVSALGDGVAEDFVGGLDALESGFAFLFFAGVAVGVVLEGEFAVLSFGVFAG